MMGMGGGGGGGGGGGLGGLAGAIAAAQAARNAGNSVHQALGMSNSAKPGNGSTNGSSNPGQFVPKMSGREMLGHANKARIAGNQIHSALGMARPPAPGTPGHAPSPPPPPPQGGGDFEGEVVGGGRGMAGIDFGELRRGVGGMMGVGKSMGGPVVRGYGEKAGCESGWLVWVVFKPSCLMVGELRLIDPGEDVYR